jgi:hypothetical protein
LALKIPILLNAILLITSLLLVHSVRAQPVPAVHPPKINEGSGPIAE